MGQRRVFTKEFKEEAVKLARTSGKTKTDIASNLGIDVNMLCRWEREYEQASTNYSLRAFPGRGNARDEEVARLRKENADLRETSDLSPPKY